MNNQLDADGYLAQRVDDQILYLAAKAGREKRRHMRFQIALIVLGVLVPVLVNAQDIHWLQSCKWVPITFQILATVVGLAVAVLTGLTNFLKPQDHWLESRMTEEALKEQRFLFLTRQGDYGKGDEKAFDTLVANVESILSAERARFRALVSERDETDTAQASDGS